tara:strand:+ start:944 stop:1324 length:381 start_codon:yes stop_codon:yes gene_type:complete
LDILIVDDSEPIRETFRKLFEKYEELLFIEAKDGQEALEILKSNKSISLIICDIKMPVMDGFTLLEKVSSDQELKTIPFFFHTTEMSPTKQKLAKKLGAKAWLPKPFKERQMIAVIQQALKITLPN